MTEFAAVALGTAGAFLETYATTHSPSHRLDLSVAHFSQAQQVGLGLVLIGAGALRAVWIRWRLDVIESENAGLQRAAAAARDSAQGAWHLADELIHAAACLVVEEAKLMSDERVSFFIEDPAKRGFILVGRDSKAPNYAAEHEHGVYAYGVGCLGEAWENDKVYVSDLPDPKEDLVAWQNVLLQDWYVRLEVSGTMTMKSRTLYAKRIPGGFGRRSLGVVVIESTRIPADAADVISQTKLSGYIARKEAFISRCFQLSGEMHLARQLDPSIDASQRTAGERVA